jgi:hypothetical protein
MILCGADIPFGFAQGRLVRARAAPVPQAFADKNVRATRASGSAVRSKEIAQ